MSLWVLNLPGQLPKFLNLLKSKNFLKISCTQQSNLGFPEHMGHMHMGPQIANCPHYFPYASQ